jgi:hypothetical protein
MCKQTTLAIPRCSVNYELGSKVEAVRSVREKGTASQEDGPCGQAYGGKWEHGRGESENKRVLSVE